MYNNEQFINHLKSIGINFLELSSNELSEHYIQYLSNCSGLTKDEICYSLIKDNPNYANFVFEDGKIVSFGQSISEWSDVKDGYRYVFKDGNFYRYDRSYRKEIISVEEVNKIFQTDLMVTEESILYAKSSDVDSLYVTAYNSANNSLNASVSIHENSYNNTYNHQFSREFGRKLMIDFLYSINYDKEIYIKHGYGRPLQLEDWTDMQLCETFSQYCGDCDITPFYYGDGGFQMTSSYCQTNIIELMLGSPSNVISENFINSSFADKYTYLLGLPTVSGGDIGVDAENKATLSFDGYTEMPSSFLNQNFTLSYNGYNFSVNYDTLIQSGIDPVEFLSSYFTSEDSMSYDNLGLATSIRMDTSIEKYKMASSNCYSDIELLSDGIYRIYFQNGQFFDISQEDFESKTAGYGNSMANLDQALFESDAYFSNVVEHHFQSVMPNATVDVRPLDDEKFMVIINGKERIYSLNTLNYMIGDTDLSDIDSNYYEDVLLEKSRNNIEQYIMSKYELSGYENIELVYNPISGRCNVIIDGKNLVLTDEDNLEISKFINEESGIDERLIDDVNNDKTSNTNNPYMSQDFFPNCIKIDDDTIYRNFVSKLKEFEYDSLSTSYGNLYRNFNFLNGQYGTGNVKTLSSNNKSLKSFADNLSKQIEACLAMLELTDNNLYAQLDQWIDEFFQVSALDYKGESKVTLSDVDNKSSIAFWENRIDEIKKQVEMYDVLLGGNIFISDEMMNKFEAMGLKFDYIPKEGDGVRRYYASGDTIAKYLSKTENIVFNDEYCIYDWLIEHHSDSLNEQNIYNNINGNDSLNANIALSYLVMADYENIANTRNGIEAFCNLKPYLKYIVSDEYATTLDEVRHGKELYYINYAGEKIAYPEYFTDFQKTLLYLENSEELPKARATQNEFQEKIADSGGRGGIGGYDIVENYYNSNVDKIEGIVPYAYNEIAGRGEALKILKQWYEDGSGIDIYEAFGYDRDKFLAGVTESVRNIGYIFNPETSIETYKLKYLGEFLVDIATKTESDVNKMYESGSITKGEKNLRIAMMNSMQGLDPNGVKEWGDVAESAGKIAFEVALYAAGNATYLGKALGKLGFNVSTEAAKKAIADGGKRLIGLVKGASTMGKNRKKLYDSGVSYGTSLLASIPSGIITYLAYSPTSSKFEVSSTDKVYKFNFARGTWSRNYTKAVPSGSALYNVNPKLAYDTYEIIGGNLTDAAIGSVANAASLALYPGFLETANNLGTNSTLLLASLLGGEDIDSESYLPWYGKFGLGDIGNNPNQTSDMYMYNVVNTFFKVGLGQYKTP